MQSISRLFDNHNILLPIGLVLLLLTVIVWRKRRKLSDRYLSSRGVLQQIFGALMKSRWSMLSAVSILFILILLQYLPDIASIIKTIPIAIWPSELMKHFDIAFITKAATIVICCILFGVTSYVVVNLNKIYSLRKMETRITWSQIILLAVFATCLAISVFTLGIEKDSNGYLILTVAGSVLGWIFQDTIKSVAAFFYLRANGLLQIGDLITVPSRGIEGFVRTISLTTVTVENWDTTTSAFPTYILHSEHFKNSQRMLEGKTLGRLMQKAFVIDTGWFHPLTEMDVERLKMTLDVDECFIKHTIKTGALNMEVFRQYVYHWMMNNQHVIQQPRLIVRWLEQTDNGMPLQIFAYLSDTMFDAFEWRQSQIMEHIVKAMGWFDLQLYQSPSGYDASNSNLFITRQAADYRKKNEDNARL